LHPNPKLEVFVFMSPSDRVAQLYLQALGYLFVAFCDLQGYGGGIQIHLRMGGVNEHWYRITTFKQTTRKTKT
jgi:hypothetical protein